VDRRSIGEAGREAATMEVGPMRSGSWLRLRRRTVREDGASAVEFAILAPLVFAILFGTLTGGFAWNSQQQITHAAREAARFGATTVAGTDGLDATLGRAQETIKGNAGLSGWGGEPSYCVAYVGVEGPGTAIRKTDGPGWPAGDRCVDDDGLPSDEGRVQVVVRQDVDLIFVLMSRTVTLNSAAVARYEMNAGPG
jgi:hypothetical protein